MKLKDWMDFNSPFMSCSFKVRVVPRNDTGEIFLEAFVSWKVCYKIFGEYEIIRLIEEDTIVSTNSGRYILVLTCDL